MIEKYVDAEELRRLLSTLVVILAVLAIGGLFAIIVVPGLRNANRPETPTPVSPVVGEPGWLDPAEFPPERGRVIPPVDPKTLIATIPRADGQRKGTVRSQLRAVSRGARARERACFGNHESSAAQFHEL